MSSQGVRIGVEEAGATARVAKRPSPIVVDIREVTDLSGPGVTSCVSLEQRGGELVSSELRFKKGQGPEQSTVGPEDMEGRRKSLSSDSPGLGELAGWAVLEQWSAEDGGASGKEATAVQDAKPVACQVKTCPDNGLNVHAASFVPRAQMEIEPVCQVVAGVINPRGGPVFLCANGPVTSQWKNRSEARRAQEVQGGVAIEQIRVKRSVALD